MMSIFAGILLLLVTAPLVTALLRANELVCLRLRAGTVRIVRGKLPQALLDELTSIFQDSHEEAELRIVVEDRTPRVYVKGELPDSHKQRVRNVVGRFPLLKFRTAPKPR